MIVALLTDFGSRDHYVGTMKGVILSVCPQATLVDLTHEIAPQDIMAGALELAAAYRYFPAGTVFLAVVDPGVGSRRRGLAADAGGYRFVGPDNGVLSLAWRDSGDTPRVVELQNATFARPTISRTFEGRDRFAPAAGYLARGTELGAFGAPVADAVMLDVPEVVETDEGVTGEVIRVDRFGNLVTNISASSIASLTPPGSITIADRLVSRIVATYADVAHNELCALIGSSGQLEISVNGASAADTLGIGRGARVIVTRTD